MCKNASTWKHSGGGPWSQPLQCELGAGDRDDRPIRGCGSVGSLHLLGHHLHPPEGLLVARAAVPAAGRVPDVPLVPVQDHRHPPLVVHDLPGGLLVDQLHAVDGLADDARDGSDCCWWEKGEF